MSISFYVPSGFDAQFDALVDAWMEMGQHYSSDEALAKAEVSTRLAADVLGPNSGVRLVLAREQDKVAGFATVSILYPGPGSRGQLFMKDLYVCSAWRRQGVGEQIMRFLAQYAISTGCARFDWTTEDTNAGAVAFYEQLGAKPVQEKVYFRLTEPEIQQLATGAGDPNPS